MTPITKQDLQNVVDTARNRIMERAASRQDVLSLQDTIKMLTTLQQQSQQLQRQAEYQRVQLVRRAVALETRMVQMEREVQNMRRAVNQLAQIQPTERVTERVIMQQVQPEQPQRVANEEAHYIYSPTPAS